MEEKLYCIEITRDCPDDNLVRHKRFKDKPTEDDILKYLEEEDIRFNKKYHSVNFYQVN